MGFRERYPLSTAAKSALGIAAVVAAVGAYVLWPRTSERVETVVESVPIERVVEREVPAYHVVERGEVAYNIFLEHPDFANSTPSDQEVAQKIIATAPTTGYAHHTIDNRMVVDGRVVEGSDGIPMDVILPGDTIPLGVQTVQETVFENQEVAREVPSTEQTGSWWYVGILGGLAGLLAAASLGSAPITSRPEPGPVTPAPRTRYVPFERTGDTTPVKESVKSNNNHYPTSQLEQAIALYQNSEVRVSDIIERTEVGKHELYSALDVAGVARRSDILAKQREERARNSRALYDQGTSVRDISAALGVSTSTVYRDLHAQPARPYLELFSNQELQRPYATLRAA